MIKVFSFVAAMTATAALGAEPVISEARMLKDMTTLASDAFEGRKPGTPSQTKTVDYIRHAFMAAGLAPGKPNEWLQPVALAERTPGTWRFSVRIGKEQLDLANDVILLGNRAAETLTNAPIAYGGYAIRPPQGMGRAADHAVVLYRNADQPGHSTPQPTDAITRTEALGDAKAAVALSIVADNAFAAMRERQNDVIEAVADFPFVARGFIKESAARRIVTAGGGDLDALDASAQSPDFQPTTLDGHANARATTKVRAFTSYNVIGRITGTRRPDEAIVYTAHWDSFGYCRPKEADKICNGGVDNASGTAGLLELARAFKAGPAPERTILFISTTAEERGLLGARAYTHAPIIPLNKTVAAFNTDTIALYPRGNPAGFVGAGYTNIDPILSEAAATQGRTLETGDGTRMVLKSSDAWAMMVAGVPAFILSGAIARSGPDHGKAFLDYIRTRYHGPKDEVSDATPMGGAVEEIELLYRAGLRVSAAKVQVNFLPDAPFKRP